MAFISQRKICSFCENSEIVINYKEYKLLRKFLTEQGKIIPGFVTGVCSKHQRHITRAIKRARNIAFLPFTVDYRDI
ncbi:MAG: 30S ribosomal protein S18 [Candidatus Marinimicrobia bacterium]|jgi:small subunit ribosomal protein S18|nr:30S ribosomal protein S18 [Candidatus Neomarinimicrobiota bacterium]MBT3632919.1 30S ribosomal protein S18 [Candidatus Neomarinimicrobiota bacterium]MBT3682029.1 30S ribosomal protein S18 [Candidatus Neomarinimicrobiota bacterium]MBT3758942.1 30S ribosomal protein S18 [Candidatus Neomarinimicrobiota bacterium]MBT3895159.1 30S ribosomal protein S18 [Candidatus Neomarinimicrobiota bacterium]